jgi:hypothetical protein
MADAYKLKADASFPRALRLVSDDEIEGKQYEVEGRNYGTGSYVLASDLTPRDRERAENGDLDHLLEGVSLDEAEQGLALVDRGLFIPEHEAEAVALETYGHEVVPRDQVLELRAEGSDVAASAQEEAKADGADERPGLTAAEFPSLAEVSRGDADFNVPKDSEHVSEERLAEAPSSSVRGVEQPPGVQVGADKAAAEGEAKRRGRPSVKKDGAAKQQETAKAAREAKANEDK